MIRSLVIYRGPSRYDPSRTIRAVLTPDSSNRKTGRMAQLYILPDDVAPQAAQQTGEDFSVCGNCPLRPTKGGGCYVVTCQGALSVWRATRGAPVAGAGEIAGLIGARGAVRLGAYGDPAALPSSLIGYIFTLAHGRVTGYTHGHLALGLAGIAHLRTSCMLSVETEAQAESAHAQGWRTFRATRPGAAPLPSEIVCPNETKGRACVDCLLCRGSSLPGARSIVIPVHGSRAGRALNVVG